MWPLITLALAALLWLLQVTLSSDSGAAGLSILNLWLTPLATGLSALAVAMLLRRVMIQLLNRSRLHHQRQGPDLLQSVLSILLYIIVALAFFHWGLHQDLGRVLATSALLSAIIGLALQSTLGHLFSGVSIQIEKTLKVGDFIRRDDIEGQVVLLSWRSVHLRTDRGSTIILPNSEFANRTLEVIRLQEPFRHSVNFNISSAHAPGQVIRIAMQVLHSGLPDVCTSPPPSVVMVSNEAASGSVRYSARFFTLQFLDRSSLASAFMERLWYALLRDGISLPQPPAGLIWPSGNDGAATAAEPIRIDQAHPPAPSQPSAPAQWPQPTPLNPGLRQRLLQAARLQQYGRHEKYQSGKLNLLIKGRMRQPQSPLEAARGEELSALIEALSAPDEHIQGIHQLEQSTFNALLHQGSLALGPVARSLADRIARLTDDPWLAWHAYGHAIEDGESRARFLSHAPSQATQALYPGTWLGWAPALGLSQTEDVHASQHCCLLEWEPELFRSLLLQAEKEDLAQLLKDLQQHASGCASLSHEQLNAWLDPGKR